MEFFSTYTRRPIFRAPKMSDEVITEQTGYMTTKQLVEQMVLAGKRLYDYRHGLLDAELPEGVDDTDDIENQDIYPVYQRDLVDEAADIEGKVFTREVRKTQDGGGKAPKVEQNENITENSTLEQKDGSEAGAEG